MKAENILAIGTVIVSAGVIAVTVWREFREHKRFLLQHPQFTGQSIYGLGGYSATQRTPFRQVTELSPVEEPPRKPVFEEMGPSKIRKGLEYLYS